MKVGVVKNNGDPITALIPKGVITLKDMGYELTVEHDAGVRSYYSNTDYENAGARILDREEVLGSSDLILTSSNLEARDLNTMSGGSYVVGKFDERKEQELIPASESQRVNVFNMELLPRISIAQSMDVLSSQASLAGYKAVILAANHLQGYMPMMTTAAGTIPPSKVLVLGAGVAGLQAIATARRLGAVVEAFDVRSAVKEEVMSLGATFVEVEGSSEDDAAGGYAIEQSAEYIQRQKELIHERASMADIVITAANIPRKKAPLILEKRTVEAMKAGSVIVDMAASNGGNCELTVNDQTIQYNNITIIGNSRLFELLPLEASRKFNNNLLNFIKFVFKDGIEGIDFDHEIVSNTLITKLQSNGVKAKAS